MKRFMDIVAKALSILLYPLFVPTYGVVLFCAAIKVHVAPLPAVWTMVAIIGTFLLTCLLPMSAIWILIHRGEISDIQIEDSTQRTVPYLYTVFGFGCWSYLMISILHAPLFIGLVAVGATIGIALVAIINRWWKISAHLTGQGGLFGGLMSYCLGIGALPTWGTICLWGAVALALMYARVRLNAHTPAQVCAGWLLGIVCSFMPYYIYWYVA